MERYQHSISTGKPWHNIERNEGSLGYYKQGYYAFEHGYVQIYAEKDFTGFKFIFKGRLHMLNLSKFEGGLMGDRQLIIRAGNFARKIIAKHG